MAYEFKKLPTGNIEVYEDGKRVATASASGARQYGYTEGGQAPAPTPNPLAPVIPEQKPAPLPAPAPAPAPTAPAPVAGQGQPQPAPTGSIVDYLKSMNQPNDFASRANLAQQRGITNYVGTAEQNTQLLNTLRQEGGKGAPKPQTQPTAQPGAVQPAPVAPGAAPAAVIQPEQAATVSFDDLMAQFGIQPSESIADVVASISKLYGFDEVNEEIKKLDKEFEDAAEKENMDPWISEGTRSRRLESMQNKYETRKKNLLDRLSIRSDIIGKSITAYNTERSYKQDMLFKALSLREEQMKREQESLKREAPKTITTAQGIMEWDESTQTWEPTGFGAAALYGGRILSPSEAQTLGVPYGTTQEEATAAGIVPTQQTAKLSIENAKSGLRAIQTMRDEIKTRGKGILFYAAIPGSPTARIFETARKETADIITRLRTGAALNEQEEEFYKSQMPSALDSEETIKYKLNLFETLFKNLSQQRKSTEIDNDPLGIRK